MRTFIPLLGLLLLWSATGAEGPNADPERQSPRAAAVDQPETEPDTGKIVEGTLVGIVAGEIVIDLEGGQQMFSIDSDVMVTRDTKPAKLSDLKEKDVVRVTTARKGSQIMAVAIDARSADAAPAE